MRRRSILFLLCVMLFLGIMFGSNKAAAGSILEEHINLDYYDSATDIKRSEAYIHYLEREIADKIETVPGIEDCQIMIRHLEEQIRSADVYITADSEQDFVVQAVVNYVADTLEIPKEEVTCILQ